MQNGVPSVGRGRSRAAIPFDRGQFQALLVIATLAFIAN